MEGFRSTPAVFWRAFFVGAWLVTAGAVNSSLAAARPSPPPPLLQTGKADPAEGRAALEQMRRQGIAGDYYLEFQLRVMPRRGDERLIPGRLWGGRNASGTLNRVSLSVPEKQGGEPVERRLLIQGGKASGLWRWEEGGGVTMPGAGALFEPLVPNSELTAFDLQMPFLYWDNFDYEGLTRFRGRPAHVLVLRPPAAFAAKHPAVKGVRVWLDTQFNALVQTEVLGERDRATKTLSLVDLKKVGEQWIPKTFDLRDETTRNKTRFSVTAVALDLDFSRGLFEPARLADELRPPADGRMVVIEP